MDSRQGERERCGLCVSVGLLVVSVLVVCDGGGRGERDRLAL